VSTAVVASAVSRRAVKTSPSEHAITLSRCTATSLTRAIIGADGLVASKPSEAFLTNAGLRSNAVPATALGALGELATISLKSVIAQASASLQASSVPGAPVRAESSCAAASSVPCVALAGSRGIACSSGLNAIHRADLGAATRSLPSSCALANARSNTLSFHRALADSSVAISTSPSRTARALGWGNTRTMAIAALVANGLLTSLTSPSSNASAAIL
jgi:hypothetical protein